MFCWAVGEDGEGMGTGRIGGWLLVLLAIAGTAAVLVVMVRAGTGDVDPGGALVGVVSLLVTVWSGWMAWQTLRWQDTDTAGLADRLAGEVERREEQVRLRLLGSSTRSINVDFTLIPAPAHDAVGAAEHGTLAQIADYYRALRPGRLVITGAPGAGKTVLALELMLLLVRAPGEPVPVPVPVRLTLSSFDPSRHSLEAWVAAALADTYRLRPAAARALVVARKVLPVLDGLDEMDLDAGPDYASRAAQALQAMNDYLQGTSRGQLIVTCRGTSYTALREARMWAEDAAHIHIQPVTAKAAWDFLISRTRTPERWQLVLDELAKAPDGPLAQGLSTPWRLTVAATVYERRHADGTWPHDPAELLNPALGTPEAVRDHLLDLLIPAVTDAATTSASTGRYTADQVRTWLTVLADYLHTNTATARMVHGRRLSGTDIVLHELWPLAGPRRARNVHALLDSAVVAASLPLVFFPTGLSLHTLSGAYLAFSLLVLVFCSREWKDRNLLGPAGRSARSSPHRLATSADVSPDVWTVVVITMFFVGLCMGISVGAGLLGGLVCGLGWSLATTALFGPGAARVRYVALLLSTRRRRSNQRLPWRLRHFLDWCCQAGLMRTAGVAYQFRHRELQDFLARTPSAAATALPPGPSARGENADRP